ncbi:MAG: hypothetical protein EXQ79_02590 [Acidimicrobiia bacterium]|nr:hypothetical protein [Acidimicrobiia bacterium]
MRADQWGTENGNGNGAGYPNGNGNGHALGTNGTARPAFLGACAKHFAARAVGKCDDCGELWCSQCIVPTTRKRQPTRCIDCALVAAGVRAPGPRRSGITNMSRHQKRPTDLF